MLHQFSRTELLIGPEGLKKLAASTVMVFGIGGVGSFTVEALARAGVGQLILVDFDDICLTNINRQIHALRSTVGDAKVDVMKARVADINPDTQVETFKKFYLPEDAGFFLDRQLNYVVDAIDTVAAKVNLAKECLHRGIPFIASMGAGNRLTADFRITDIAKTSGDPLAKAVRKMLRREGITTGFKVVYSPEPSVARLTCVTDCRDNCICPGGDAHCAKKRQIPGSISFVPSVAGLILAGEVVRDLLNDRLPAKNGSQG